MERSTIQLQTGHYIGLLAASAHLLYKRHQILVGSFQIAAASWAWYTLSPKDDQTQSIKKEIHPLISGALLGSIIGAVAGIIQLPYQSWKSHGSFWEKSGFAIGTLALIKKATDAATENQGAPQPADEKPPAPQETKNLNNEMPTSEDYATLIADAFKNESKKNPKDKQDFFAFVNSQK